MKKSILLSLILVILCGLLFSADALTWTKQESKLPTPTQMHGLVIGKGYVYVLGGNSIAEGDTFAVFYAPIDENGIIGSWSRATNMPIPSNDSGAYPLAAYIEHSCFEANGFVYRIGGGWNSQNPGGDNNADSIWGKIEADGNITSWGVRAPFPTGIETGGLWGPAAYTVINGTTFVYAVSGQADDGSRTPKVFMSIADPITGELSAWTEVANIPFGMWFNTAYCVGTTLYTFCGLTTSSSDGGRTQDIYKTTINPDGTLQTWSTDTLPWVMMGLYGPGVAKSKHVIYVIGGRQRRPIGPPGSGGSVYHSSRIYKATVYPDGSLSEFQDVGYLFYGNSSTAMHYTPAVIHTVGKQERIYIVGARCSMPEQTGSRNINNPDWDTETYGLSSAIFVSEPVYTLPSISGLNVLTLGQTGVFTMNDGTPPYSGWASSDTTVLEIVSYDGNSAVVHAVGLGTATITAQDAYGDIDYKPVLVTATEAPLAPEPKDVEIKFSEMMPTELKE